MALLQDENRDISKNKAIAVVLIVVLSASFIAGFFFYNNLTSENERNKLEFEENQKTADSDNDGLSDYNEINIHKTDPNNADSDGGGVTDLDEVLTYSHYGMNPNNATDDHELIAKIPNVTANHWELDDLSKGYSIEKFVHLSLSDPLIKYLASKSEIKWIDNAKSIGWLLVDGKPLWSGGTNSGTTTADNPSFYYTLGDRNGTCATTTTATLPILSLKDIKSIAVPMGKPGADLGHVASAALIDGSVYIVDFGRIIPWDVYFKETDYVVNSTFDQNWYMKD